MSTIKAGAVMGGTIWLADMLLRPMFGVSGAQEFFLFLVEGAAAILVYNSLKSQTGAAAPQSRMIIDSLLAGFIIYLGNDIFRPLVSGNEIFKFFLDGLFVYWAIQFVNF